MPTTSIPWALMTSDRIPGPQPMSRTLEPFGTPVILSTVAYISSPRSDISCMTASENPELLRSQ